MTLKQLLFPVSALLLFLPACEKERDEFTPVDSVPLYPRGQIGNFFLGMDQAPDTVFTVSNQSGFKLRSHTGVLVEIEPETFGIPGGAPAEGTIHIAWKEIRTLYDQVSRRMSLRLDNQWMRPYLLFEWSAHQEGTPLELRKPVVIKWPENQPAGALQLWHGQWSEPSGFTWNLSSTGGVSLSTWVDPVQGSGTNGYLVSTDQTGISGAVLVEDARTDSLQATFFPAYSKTNTAVYFLDTDHGSALAFRDNGAGLFILPGLPAGRNGRVVCVTEAIRYRFYSSWKDITTPSPGWEPRPTERQLPVVYEMLRGL